MSNEQLMADGWSFLMLELEASFESEQELLHYGVKGMKWGVRKSRASQLETPPPRAVQLRDGGFLTMEGNRPNAVQKIIATLAPGQIKKMNDSYSYNLKDREGKDVGSMFLFQESPTSLNVNWVSVKESARGNGYATAAMQGAIGLARSKGLMTVTLEVPGESPDARHIYEKLGFQDKGRLDSTDDVWGGLTAMQLDLDSTASHDRIVITEDILLHYGVPGMRWGKRKNGVSTAKMRPRREKSDDKADAAALKKRPAASLSNKELKRLNERLQLERQYSDLKQSDRAIKSGYKAIKGVVGVAGTAAAVYGLSQNPAVKDLRKVLDGVGTAVIAAKGMYG